MNLKQSGGLPTPSTSFRGQADIDYTGQRAELTKKLKHKE